MTPLIVWDGDFGRAVAGAVGREHGAIGVVAAGEVRDEIERASSVAYVSWRWCDATAERLADAARSAGRSFFLVQLDGRCMIVGPHFAADGPCYRCFRSRYLVQTADAAYTLAFWQRFAGDPAAGVAGFTPAMVRIAAAATLDALAAPQPDPTVSFIDVLSGDFRSGEVAAVHSCPGIHHGAAGPERFAGAFVSLFPSEVQR